MLTFLSTLTFGRRQEWIGPVLGKRDRENSRRASILYGGGVVVNEKKKHVFYKIGKAHFCRKKKQLKIGLYRK